MWSGARPAAAPQIRGIAAAGPAPRRRLWYRAGVIDRPLRRIAPPLALFLAGALAAPLAGCRDPDRPRSAALPSGESSATSSVRSDEPPPDTPAGAPDDARERGDAIPGEEPRASRQAVILTASGAPPAPFLVTVLERSGFEVSHAGPDGEVPLEAILLVADPGSGPLEPALARADEHLAAGGAALVALEPRAGAGLGPLEARLGLRLVTHRLADDKAHLRRRGDVTDHAILATDAVAAHPTTASMTGPARSVLIYVGAGSLRELDPPAGASRLVTVRSMATAFEDRDGDHLPGAGEAAAAHPLAAAVELPGGARAVIHADASWLTDEVLRNVPSMQLLLRDTALWLAP